MTKNYYLSKLKMFDIKILFICYRKYAQRKYPHQHKKINSYIIYIKKRNLTIFYNFEKIQI